MNETLHAEHRAFEAALPELLEAHRDEFVVFHGLEPVHFTDSFDSAHDFAIDEYGPDEIVLIAQVAEPDTRPISYAWEYGVMFSE